MRLLLLHGVNCTKNVWEYLSPYMSNDELVYVEYPHDVTLKANRVGDMAKWVYENYRDESFDAIIGHSLGGIIALQLVSEFNMKFEKIIILDTNLKPANEFYRNLMTSENMNQFREIIIPMFKEEGKFYTQQFYDSIQCDFDYTNYLTRINQKVYGIYGDRNMPDYDKKIHDLNLSDSNLEKLELRFINNACHMIMMENPMQLSETIEAILRE